MDKKKRFNLLAALHFLFIGSVYAALQILATVICDNLSPGDDISSLVSSIFAGAAVTVLLMSELTERKTHRFAIITGCLCVSAGALLIIFAEKMWHVVAALLLCGFGIGGSQSTVMSLLEFANPCAGEKVLCLDMALYGLGGFITPIIIRTCFAEKTYIPEFLVIAVISFMLTAVYILFRGLDSYEPEKITDDKHRGASFMKVLDNRVLLISMAGLALFVGLESAITYWAVNVFEGIGAGDKGSFAVSIYWIASMAGGFISGLIKNASHHLPLMMASGALLIPSVILIPSPFAKLACMFLIGLIIGPAYTLLSYLGGHSCGRNSAAGYTMMSLGANLGGALMQPLVSFVASRVTVAAVFYTAAVFCVICSLLAFFINRTTAEQ